MTNRHEQDRKGKRQKPKYQLKKDEKPSRHQTKKPSSSEPRPRAAEPQYVYSSNSQYSGPWNTEAYHYDHRQDEDFGQDRYQDQGSSAQQPDHLAEDDYRETGEYQYDEETLIEVRSATWSQGQGQPMTGESGPTAIEDPYSGSPQYPGYGSLPYQYSTQPQPHITHTWGREDGDGFEDGVDDCRYEGDGHSAQYYPGQPTTSGRRAEPYVDDDGSMVLQLSSRSSTWNSQSSDENADARPETYSQENSLLGLHSGRSGDFAASLPPIPRRLVLLDEESSNPGPRADGDAANQPQLDLPPPACVAMSRSGSSPYYLMTLPDRTTGASASSHYDTQSHSYSSSSSASSSLPSYATTRDGQSHSSSHSNRRRGPDPHNTSSRRRDRSERRR